MRNKTVGRAAVCFVCLFGLLFASACAAVGQTSAPLSSDAPIETALETPSSVSPHETTPKASPASETPTTETVEESVTPAPAFRDLSPLSSEHYMPSFEEFSYERSEPVEYIMLHFSSNVLGKPEDPYNIEDMVGVYTGWESSANYVIDREGNIYCFVPEYRCAWHAGKGTWKDDERLTDRMNFYSIGIELLAIGSQKDMSIYMSAHRYKKIPKEFIGYTDAQYEALSALLDDLSAAYGIPADRDHIIGHEEYAPDRKNDPGELFDWSRALPAG